MLSEANTERMKQIEKLALEMEFTGEVVMGILCFGTEALRAQHCPTCRAGYLMSCVSEVVPEIDHKFQQMERDKDAARN